MQPSSTAISSKRKSGTKIQRMMKQNYILKRLKQFLATRQYRSVQGQGVYSIYVVYFADAARPYEHGHFRYIGGLVIGEPIQKSIFHSVGWHSHLSKRPVKSSRSAETVATGEALELCLICVRVIFEPPGTGINLVIAVKCKDLYQYLLRARTPTDKFIIADVRLIQYYFDTKQLRRMIWTPGTTNLADALTKMDNKFLRMVCNMLYDGTIQCSFENAESFCTYKSVGRFFF